MASASLQVESNERTRNGTTYQPLSSVWEGTDAELLNAMLDFYPSIDPQTILGAAYITGRIWQGSAHVNEVVSMDIDPQYEPTIFADNRVMAEVSDQESPCPSLLPAYSRTPVLLLKD